MEKDITLAKLACSLRLSLGLFAAAGLASALDLAAGGALRALGAPILFLI